ncbi:hypothetical protein Fmac_001243 [Flemingia macrophylla]|uniref:Uncharacterized protein n=1 Tax=Flemingia macrophylla TaxID=520843 RepID=A0ABD1NH96_9FABA
MKKKNISNDDSNNGRFENRARVAVLELVHMMSVPISLIAVLKLKVPKAIMQGGSCFSFRIDKSWLSGKISFKDTFLNRFPHNQFKKGCRVTLDILRRGRGGEHHHKTLLHKTLHEIAFHRSRSSTGCGDRLVGQIAKCQAIVNLENTFFSVKRFIGKRCPRSTKRESRRRCSLLKPLCYAMICAAIPPLSHGGVTNAKTLASRRCRLISE